MPVTAYIALGSNLGDRRAHLDGAVQRLRAQGGVSITRVSSYHETDPVGGPAGQQKFLNAVAEVQTDLEAAPLLRALLAIEGQMGRTRGERWGPRIIDLDLLLYGTETIELHAPDVDLSVPHPRLHERRFALAPLVEIAPLAVHPVLQSTAADLLRRLIAMESPPPGREIAGRIAVVTGSTSGIGLAIALALAAAGAGVVVQGPRSAAAPDEVAPLR